MLLHGLCVAGDHNVHRLNSNLTFFNLRQLLQCLNLTKARTLNPSLLYGTAQKKFFIKYFFNKCDQIRSFLRIWLRLLKKSLLENLIFCTVWFYVSVGQVTTLQTRGSGIKSCFIAGICGPQNFQRMTLSESQAHLISYFNVVSQTRNDNLYTKRLFFLSQMRQKNVRTIFVILLIFLIKMCEYSHTKVLSTLVVQTSFVK